MNAKTIVLFGAGKSATVLIHYLLEEASPAKMGWQIIISDADENMIIEKTKGNPLAKIEVLDITNEQARKNVIQRADLIISMMPPSLHILIAKDCLAYKKNLLTASYADDEIKALDAEIKNSGLLFLYEMGLDPGIDHMSAMHILDELKSQGAEIKSFKSHCGGLVAPESNDNPWQYKITWNPRNIVLAGKSGAIYKSDGAIVIESYEELFDATRRVYYGESEQEIFGFYPNRNSIPYIDLYGLHEAETFMRTTLRYPDFIYGWKNIIDLKLTDETVQYDTTNVSLHEFFRKHLDQNGFGDWLQQKLTERFAETKTLLENLMKLMEAEEAAEIKGEEIPENFLMVDHEGELKNIEIDEIKNSAASAMAHKMHEANLIMKQLIHLGLNDEETFINKGMCSAADILQFSLERKLALAPGDKDMIVMLHEIEYILEGESRFLKSSLAVIGDDNFNTAMAKTVGLPLGIAAKLILNGSINLTGLQVPVSKQIYEPVLKELKEFGISFSDDSE